MLKVRATFTPILTTLLAFSYRTPQNPGSFQRRITKFQKNLDRYDRKFQIRPPDLSNKQTVTFPITIPLRVRHRYNPKKLNTFVDNSSTIHWNRLSPNQILLALQHVEYLEFNQMLEGLKYLSEVQGQQQHDWNSHPWVSKAMNRVNEQFNRVKKGEHLKMYYLMKKLKFNNEDFWRKVYGLIEQNLYDLYPSELQKFFLKYYKVSDQYFSSEMKDKFLTIVEGRLRNFSPEGIVKVYQILQEQNKLNDFFKFNVFIPLFKNQAYTYTPKDLHKIFKFMLVLGHEKDDRLYKSLYNRLTGFQTLTQQDLDNLEEVIAQIKDLFVTHRVDNYIEHLKQMRIKMKQINSSQKKQIPIQELVRQDLVFFLHQRKLKAEQSSKQSILESTRLNAQNERNQTGAQ